MDVMFSIIVPIYKVEKYLKKCIESILMQTYKDFELILIDDGSPDKCPVICDEYLVKDNRIRVVHKENGGLVAARNTGLKEAIGKFVCYVDGDDWIASNLLETVYMKAIETSFPDIIVYSAVRVFDTYEEEIPKSVPEGLYDKTKLNDMVYPFMIYDSRQQFCNGLIFPVTWNKIYKRSLIKNHYCTEERIRMGEDNAFVYECLYAAEKVYFCDDILYYYNQLNATSMVHSYDSKRFENNQLLTKYIETHLGNKEQYLDEQINAFKAYWLIMAVFHEIKCGRNINEAARHIKNEILKTKVLKGIHFEGLPKMAKAYLVLLNCRLFYLTSLATKIVNKRRENK